MPSSAVAGVSDSVRCLGALTYKPHSCCYVMKQLNKGPRTTSTPECRSPGVYIIKNGWACCRPVKSWKRMTDPATGAPKGFGFCEYEEVEGVLCALRTLNSLRLDGQELLLKTNTATQRYIEAWQKQRAAAAAAAAAAAKADAAEAAAPGAEPGADVAAAPEVANGVATADAGADGVEAEKPAEQTEEERDNEVLERVMALVSERAAAAGGGRDAGGAAADADSFLSSLHDERRGGSSGDRRSRGGDRRRCAATMQQDMRHPCSVLLAVYSVALPYRRVIAASSRTQQTLLA